MFPTLQPKIQPAQAFPHTVSKVDPLCGAQAAPLPRVSLRESNQQPQPIPQRANRRLNRWEMYRDTKIPT
jgi:hypothetical protein